MKAETLKPDHEALAAMAREEESRRRWQIDGEVADAARWCAQRGIAGNEGDPLPPLMSAAAVEKVAAERVRFQASIRWNAAERPSPGGWYCRECGSRDVDVEMWVPANVDMDTPFCDVRTSDCSGSGDAFCNNCESETGLTDDRREAAEGAPGAAPRAAGRGGGVMKTKLRCDNCGKVHEDTACRTLAEIKDLAFRLDPGSEVPAGECPDCGAFVYRVREEAR